MTDKIMYTQIYGYITLTHIPIYGVIMAVGFQGYAIIWITIVVFLESVLIDRCILTVWSWNKTTPAWLFESDQIMACYSL